jgi:hypothetical protein
MLKGQDDWPPAMAIKVPQPDPCLSFVTAPAAEHEAKAAAVPLTRPKRRMGE